MFAISSVRNRLKGFLPLWLIIQHPELAAAGGCVVTETPAGSPTPAYKPDALVAGGFRPCDSYQYSAKPLWNLPLLSLSENYSRS
jgi:hypothetical protein